MEEIRRVPWNAKRMSYMRVAKNILRIIAIALVVAILITVVGTVNAYGILKAMGLEVNVAKPIDWQETFQPGRYNSPNNVHHTQVDNDPNRFWELVETYEAKGNLDDYFVIQVPIQDGTWMTEYVVSWRNY